ncbi:hypothetical protein M9H77_17359 [Catharanthus roseus]|uniref:Uncharacterized protein n=1 Tax=Catharanthus roseus TaxID=4058 RepID=A0ACC0B4E5_CATRO|nr:hypothetical protein M9H77_17359 [Catharanthus roseus]
MKKKINNLNISEELKDSLEKLFIESDESEEINSESEIDQITDHSENSENNTCPCKQGQSNSENDTQEEDYYKLISRFRDSDINVLIIQKHNTLVPVNLFENLNKIGEENFLTVLDVITSFKFYVKITLLINHDEIREFIAEKIVNTDDDALLYEEFKQYIANKKKQVGETSSSGSYSHVLSEEDNTISYHNL